MKHIVLPPSTAGRALPFYLATEEWVARSLPAAEYFFCWRVAPTVICGRNQNIQVEVDLDYCSREGIDVVRRRSGGGAVLADMNNFMFSYIAPGDNISVSFGRYTSMIASMLYDLGLDARATGRNDIMIGDRKVAGNAFYHLPGRCIAHGTMLYDFDSAKMSRALTPSRAKLSSKGVKSVPSRVTSLRAEGLRLSHSEFEDYAISKLTDEKIFLTEKDIAEISELEKAYRAPDFFNGHGRAVSLATPHPDLLIERQSRVEGAGSFDLIIKLDKEKRIEELSLAGDYFLLDDPYTELLVPMKGRIYDESELRSVISSLSPEKVIPGLTKEQLLHILI